MKGGQPSFDEIFLYPVRLIAQQPKILLLGALNFIPVFLFSFLLADFLVNYSSLATQLGQAIASQDPQAYAPLLGELWNALMKYLPNLILLAILSILIGLIVSLAYVQLLYQARKAAKKGMMHLSLSDSLQIAFSKLFTTIAAYFWYAIVAIAMIIGLVILFALGAAMGGIGFVIIIPAFLLAIAAFFIIFLMGAVVEAIVIFENKGGLQCIRHAYKFAMQNKWWGSAVLIIYLILALVLNQLLGYLSNLPFGFAFYAIGGLLTGAWQMMVSGMIYVNLSGK